MARSRLSLWPAVACGGGGVRREALPLAAGTAGAATASFA